MELIKAFQKATESERIKMDTWGRWLTTDDMAKPADQGGYDIPKQTQSKMRMNGKIPYSKISSKYIRYDRIEIDKWLENHAIVKA